LQNPSVIHQNFPHKLLYVEIDMGFKNDDILVKEELYLRILKGLVFFPKSNVKQIAFQNLNNELFTEATDKSL
jgi:hypothetical protein